MAGADDDAGNAKVTLFGRLKEKLIAAKEKAARERRHDSGAAVLPGDNARNRLPPG